MMGLTAVWCLFYLWDPHPSLLSIHTHYIVFYPHTVLVYSLRWNIISNSTDVQQLPTNYTCVCMFLVLCVCACLCCHSSYLQLRSTVKLSLPVCCVKLSLPRPLSRIHCLNDVTSLSAENNNTTWCVYLETYSLGLDNAEHFENECYSFVKVYAEMPLYSLWRHQEKCLN